MDAPTRDDLTRKHCRPVRGGHPGPLARAVRGDRPQPRGLVARPRRPTDRPLLDREGLPGRDRLLQQGRRHRRGRRPPPRPPPRRLPQAPPSRCPPTPSAASPRTTSSSPPRSTRCRWPSAHPEAAVCADRSSVGGGCAPEPTGPIGSDRRHSRLRQGCSPVGPRAAPDRVRQTPQESRYQGVMLGGDVVPSPRSAPGLAGGLEPSEAAMVSLRLVVAGLMIIPLLAAGMALARRRRGPRGRSRALRQAVRRRELQGGLRGLPTAGPRPEGRARSRRRRPGAGDLVPRGCSGGSMRSTPSATRSSPPTRTTGGCSRRRPRACSTSEHFGFLVAGDFHRGPHRGGGRNVGSSERDRARALQLLARGLDRARSDPDRAAAGRYLLTLARALLSDREDGESWRLQALTPLDALPDYDESPWRHWGRQQAGARRARRHARLSPRPRELREGEERR